ncbi:MAG: DNA/RNA nuclease SfsA [Thermoplasmata archaeon]|nr:DNA/RNA nuclease SfsA [Thermoplasmata archaeon]
MRYGRIVQGKFINRPNRFIAYVDIGGTVEMCHVKNTGRCKEILVPGAVCILYDSDNPSRKTRYDLIAAYKGGNLINIDSQAPNAAFKESIPRLELFGDSPEIHPEYTHGDSRFDFLVIDGDRKCFVEVKGVTLEIDGVCRFPDAPTERGVKHLKGLMAALDEGYECYVALIVQMKGMHVFEPNYDTHEEFGMVLEEAYRKGVGILVYDCIVQPDSMTVDSPIPFRFR